MVSRRRTQKGKNALPPGYEERTPMLYASAAKKCQDGMISRIDTYNCMSPAFKGRFRSKLPVPGIVPTVPIDVETDDVVSIVQPGTNIDA